MIRIIIGAAAALLLISVNSSTGLKWLPLKYGDPIPKNAVNLYDGVQKFVGRARHYDEILLAAVNSTLAMVESCGKNIIKRKYEILVSRDSCRWQTFSQIEQIPENVVRGGTAANGEPTYIGRYLQSSLRRIEPIYLSSKAKNRVTMGQVLLCEDTNIWIDTDSTNIPNNTVYGGESEDGRHIYVARLKSGCSIIPGQVAPELTVASAEYKMEKIRSNYCQVLVGEPNEYMWVTEFDGEIPEYAVASSKDKSGELMYVALINKTIGYVTYSIAAKLNSTYGVLVRNGV